jgi:hypothetical protein
LAHDEDPKKILPECAAGFARIDQAVEGFTEAVREFRTQNLEAQRRITSVEASTRSAWHEIRRDVIPDLKAIPGQVRLALSDHKRECPAYNHAMDRATRRYKTTPPSGTSTAGLFGSSRLLKWVVYIAFILGGMIAGAGVTLGYWEVADSPAKPAKVNPADKKQ